MVMAMVRFLLIFAVFCGAVGLAHKAQASVRLCNETSYVLNVATAYKRGMSSKTEGWIMLLPGMCRTSKKMPKNASAFVYARSDTAHAGQALLFTGSERFCVGEEKGNFTIEGRRECRRRGYFEADFAPVARNRGSSLVEFTEKPDYGRRRARAAGVQRILNDLQYNIGAVDGFGGARTREAIAAYKSRYGVSGNLQNEKLLRALIKSLRQEARQRGLILCNKTKHAVWVATGMVKGDSFESSGWLRVTPANCAQSLNRPLNDRFYFYYAEAVTKNGRPLMQGGQRKIWAGDFSMCIKQTRFVIDGTQNCHARGFKQAQFRKIDTGLENKWRVDLE